MRTRPSLFICLKELGYSVAVAHNGKSGLAVVETPRPDIVLSDIRLQSELGGYAIASAINSDETLRLICLIAVSRYVSKTKHNPLIATPIAAREKR